KLGNGVELKAVGLKSPNQFGKHADVLIRVRQTNAKQITLLEKNQFQQISKNMSTKSLGPAAFKHDKVLSLSRQAADEMWELRRLTGAPWLSSVKVGGALAFGPTFIDDLLNNYNHSAKLDQKFNYKKFAVDSVKNQSGNVIAMVGGTVLAKGTAITIAIITGTAIAGAPLIVMTLGFGIVVGALYSDSEFQRSVEQRAKNFFGTN
ncbi:MAG: hypothetical protein AB1516_13855, partial [Pseudomonadota bacterium]